MRKRIDFSLDDTLGDAIASDFNGIFGLNCYEYTLWQLIRQANIKDDYASLNTNVFLNKTNKIEKINMNRSIIRNLEVIEENLNRFYSIHRISIQNFPTTESIHSFINGAIDENRFVYMLYNNYFDSHNYRSLAIKKHEYHCTLITGYDDEKGAYIPLIDGIYNIYYDDYSVMSKDFKRLSEIVFSWSLFYLSQKEEKLLISKEKLLSEFAQDVLKDMEDWTEETDIFDSYFTAMKAKFLHITGDLNNEEIQNLWNSSCTLHNVKISISGNLRKKLNAISELSKVDFMSEADEFIKGREKVSILANTLGRLAIDYNTQKFIEIIDKLSNILINDSRELKDKLYKKIINL